MNFFLNFSGFFKFIYNLHKNKSYRLASLTKLCFLYGTSRNLSSFNKSCSFKFLVCLHGEYNILVKLCGNTT